MRAMEASSDRRGSGALRIAIVSPASTEGRETFIHAHVTGLDRVEHVFEHGTLPRTIGGRSILRTGTVGRLVDRVCALPYGGSLNALLAARVGRSLRDGGVDVVLAEYGHTGAVMAPICARLGLPLVVHFHGHDAYRPQLIREHGGYVELFRTAYAAIAVSRHMRMQLIGLGAPEDKVIYNSYGIDPQRFTPGDPLTAPPLFIAVGRFTPKKAPQLTLQAFAQVVREFPDARLEMIGKGHLLDECRAWVREQGLEQAVSFPGGLPPVEVAAHMRGARAFVQHSVVAADNDHEGTPLAVLEAMSCALPVIATRHAGIPDVVEHGVQGLLCAEHDVDAMAGHMLRMLRDPASAAAMGRRGRADVEQEHTLGRKLAVLQEVLRRAAATRR